MPADLAGQTDKLCPGIQVGMSAYLSGTRKVTSCYHPLSFFQLYFASQEYFS